MSEIVVKKKKKKVKVFPIVNAIIFILISLIILVPPLNIIVNSNILAKKLRPGISY